MGHPRRRSLTHETPFHHETSPKFFSSSSQRPSNPLSAGGLWPAAPCIGSGRGVRGPSGDQEKVGPVVRIAPDRPRSGPDAAIRQDIYQDTPPTLSSLPVG